MQTFCKWVMLKVQGYYFKKDHPKRKQLNLMERKRLGLNFTASELIVGKIAGKIAEFYQLYNKRRSK